MSEVKDCREDIINQLTMWAIRHGIDASEAKDDFYIMLNNVEVTSRSTEIAELKEDRNEMLLKRFLIAKQVKNLSERTIKAYDYNIRRVLDRIGKTIDDITTDDIRYYEALRLRKDKITSIGLDHEIRSIGSFFTWLYDEEIIRKNPMKNIEPIKKEKTKKEAFIEMEIEQMREVVEESLKDKMMVEVLLSTGCRVDELRKILISEIEEDRILVHGKGAKDRYVYLNAKAQLALEKYLSKRKDRNPYLFPKGATFQEMIKKGYKRKELKNWWMNPNNIREGFCDKASIEQRVRKIKEKAGVKSAYPHKFRRTCATFALRRGMPIEQVSQMLGHESLRTTQIYLDLTEEDLALAHKKYVV